MDQPVRCGIVGCGVIGATHAEAIRDLPEADLVAVADTIPERAHALGGRFGAHPFVSLDEMLDDADLDLVSVCTASGRHGEHAEAIMRSGRHVIVEKPLEISLAAIDRVLEVQRETGVTLAVISQHRWDPASRRVHQLIATGALGRPVLADAQIEWWRSQAYYSRDGWRGTWELDGGGVLMNQGIHTVDLLIWLMGPVRSVRAYTDTRVHAIDTEDVAVAALRFAGGALGTIAATTGAYPGVTTRIAVMGDRGSAVIERDRLTDLRLAGEREDVPAYGLEGQDPVAPDEAGSADALTGHAAQIDDMIRAIRTGASPLVDGMAGRRAVETVLAIYRSAATGEEVTLDDASVGLRG